MAVKENATSAQSREVYLKKYESLKNRYLSKVDELERLEAERTRCQQQDKTMSLFIRTLKTNPQALDNWDVTIWTVMVEKGVVHKDKSITFVFNNGAEIKVGAE